MVVVLPFKAKTLNFKFGTPEYDRMMADASKEEREKVIVCPIVPPLK
jgi:hypothetical protein